VLQPRRDQIVDHGDLGLGGHEGVFHLETIAHADFGQYDVARIGCGHDQLLNGSTLQHTNDRRSDPVPFHDGAIAPRDARA
jgi:hypothetical protein